MAEINAIIYHFTPTLHDPARSGLDSSLAASSPVQATRGLGRKPQRKPTRNPEETQETQPKAVPETGRQREDRKTA